MNVLPPSLPLPDPEDTKALWDTLRQLYERTASAVNSIVPTGTVWLVSSVPSGWLLCNGAAISRVAYSNLFSVVGTTFGAGDGRTTFNLPNITGPVTGITYVIRT